MTPASEAEIHSTFIHCSWKNIKHPYSKLRFLLPLLLPNPGLLPPLLPPSPKVKMVPIQLHDFSTLWWCGNNKHSVETILQSLNFNLFLGLVISRDAGQLPVSHRRGTNRPSYCILCFMFQIASCLQNNLWPRNSKSGYMSYGLEKPSHFQKRQRTQKYCCLVVCDSEKLETTESPSVGEGLSTLWFKYSSERQAAVDRRTLEPCTDGHIWAEINRV